MGVGHDSIEYDRIVATGLRLVDIQTVDNEWPTCDYVSAPTGYLGKSIANATKVPGRMKVFDKGQLIYDSGEYLSGVHGMTLRIRGNSSAYNNQKPYKITLEDKADLLFRNNPSYRDKDWLLLRDNQLKNLQGFEINRILAMTWTPGYSYVNLIINNEYQGVYMLVESVKRNTNCRIPVSKNGFIIEHDAYWWTESYHVISYLHVGRHYTFKYPETDDLTRGDKDFIKPRLTAFENSIPDGTYPEHIDVPSLAKWCLGQDILGTSDAGGVNVFFMLNDREEGTLFKVPLMWDFDSSEFTPDMWSRPHRVIMQNFFKNVNRDFVDAFVAEWQRIGADIDVKMLAVFKKFYASEQGQGFINSMPLSNERWETYYDGAFNSDTRGAWFISRKLWLNEQVGKLNPRGDVDIDGLVDIADVNQMINMMTHKVRANLRVADLNSDAMIDVDDLNILVNMLVGKD